MVGVFLFLLAWFFVIVPLYKSVTKSRASKQLNNELVILANHYEHSMRYGQIQVGQVSLEVAQEKVQHFASDIRFTPSELVQVLPAVSRFPNWQAWLR